MEKETYIIAKRYYTLGHGWCDWYACNPIKYKTRKKAEDAMNNTHYGDCCDAKIFPFSLWLDLMKMKYGQI